MITKMKIKDIHGKSLKIGDKVRILKITDDSGNAADLFGVEPQLNGWVDIIYIETFEGVITFDEVKLMVVIKGKYRDIPLSPEIRYTIWDDIYDRIKGEDLDRINEELDDLKDTEYETIIDYIEKI